MYMYLDHFQTPLPRQPTFTTDRESHEHELSGVGTLQQGQLWNPTEENSDIMSDHGLMPSDLMHTIEENLISSGNAGVLPGQFAGREQVSKDFLSLKTCTYENSEDTIASLASIGWFSMAMGTLGGAQANQYSTSNYSDPNHSLDGS